MAGDLAAAGWELCYLPRADRPPPGQPPPATRSGGADGIRNTLWTTWLRRPLRPALRRTVHLLRTVPRDRVSARGCWRRCAGMPWVLRERRVLPRTPRPASPLSSTRRARSAARRYVS